MKAKLLLLPLAFLFSFPAFGCAADRPAKAELPASYYSASAKRIAESYVVLIKEHYAGRNKDQLYDNARLKYEAAAAKFSGVRSTIELEVIGGSRIPNVNDSRYQAVVLDALQAFDEFSAAAQKIVSSPALHSNAQEITTQSFATVITDIFSFVTKFQEIWVKHDQIRETRLKKLDEWIDRYYTWPGWEDIGKNTGE